VDDVELARALEDLSELYDVRAQRVPGLWVEPQRLRGGGD
jgi:hypothetical protein